MVCSQPNFSPHPVPLGPSPSVPQFHYLHSFIPPNRLTLPSTQPLFTYSSLYLKYPFPSLHITPRSPYNIPERFLSAPACPSMDYTQFAIIYAFVYIFDFCIYPPPDYKFHWEDKIQVMNIFYPYYLA